MEVWGITWITNESPGSNFLLILLKLLPLRAYTCSCTHTLLQFKSHAWAPLWLVSQRTGLQNEDAGVVCIQVSLCWQNQFSNCTLLVSLTVLLVMSPELSTSVPHPMFVIHGHVCTTLRSCPDIIMTLRLCLYSQTAVSQLGLESHSEWEVNYFM